MKNTTNNLACFLLFAYSLVTTDAVAETVAESVTDTAAVESAELVWASSTGELNRILYSEWNGDNWSDPKVIYQSENSTASPALATLADGSKALIWSEQRRRKSVLMWSKRSAAEPVWSTATVFSRLGSENVAPSIVRDLEGSLWVFWSAQKSGYSDVFYTRQLAGDWSQPQQVNQANEVPDIKPLAFVGEQGEIVVEWRSFSFDAQDYVTQTRAFEPITGLKASLKKRFRQETDPQKTPIPSFISATDFATIHLAKNIGVQSFRIELDDFDL